MEDFDFSKAFNNNQKLSTPDKGEVIFTVHYLDELVTVSGNLIACDPLCFFGSDPLRERLQPGRYPVIVSTIDGIIAFAQVRVQEKTPVKWEPEYTVGDTIYGYPVDSGTGGFFDEVVADIMFDCDFDDEIYGETLIKILEEKEKNKELGWANLCIDPSTQANVIAFWSGTGDGSYPSYFGYDEENNLVSIVTDFLLFEKSGSTWL
jgi:hypothetical protein